MKTRTVSLAVLLGLTWVEAGPCGYGALCGRSACDGPTMAAYEKALPGMLACQAAFDPYFSPPTDETTARTACFLAPCNAAFNDIVRFSDLESNVCEIHYPTRRDNTISGGYSSFCFGTLNGFPTLQAEMAARLAVARGQSPSAAPITAAPGPTTMPPLSPMPTTTDTAPAPASSPPTTATTASPTLSPGGGSTSNETDSIWSSSSSSSGSNGPQDDSVVATKTTVPSTTPVSSSSVIAAASPYMLAIHAVVGVMVAVVMN